MWYRLQNYAAWQRAEDGAMLTQLEVAKFPITKREGISHDEWLDFIWKNKPDMLPSHYFQRGDYVKLRNEDRWGEVVDMDNNRLYIKWPDSEWITGIEAGRFDLCTPDGEVIEPCPHNLRKYT